MSNPNDSQRALRSQLTGPPVSDDLLYRVRNTLANIGSTIQDLSDSTVYFDHHFNQLVQDDPEIGRLTTTAELRADARDLERRLSNPSSLVRRRIALFESRSTGNLASGHTHFTENLPHLPPRDSTMPSSVNSGESSAIMSPQW